MTTDITELAQSLKAAITEATPGGWYVDYDFDVCTEGCGFIAETHGNNLVHNAQYIALANPANILALVEALEKEQQRIGRLEKKLTDHKRMNQEMAKAMLTPNDSDAAGMEIAALRQRIAELESRTVKLPKRRSMLLREDFNDDYHTEMAYKADEVQASLAAAGIKVEAE
mgnify:CR=1 FL=1